MEKQSAINLRPFKVGSKRNHSEGRLTTQSWRTKIHITKAASVRILREGGLGALVSKVCVSLVNVSFKHTRRSLRIISKLTGDEYRTQYESALESARDNTPRHDIFSNSMDSPKSVVKLIAFYLPQFHSIPENDAWWGKGYTEWTVVSRAVPQFLGHYQPRLPGELGFYDLRIVDNQKRQIDLARRHGIYGFCYYYYWFDGKLLLDAPLKQYLSHPELNFPFALCWANQNWTRLRDGGNSQVLQRQTYPDDWHLRFIADLARIFRDKRYIRINRRPLLVIYNPRNLPAAKSVLLDWRSYCKKRGIGDLYIVGAQTFEFYDPTPLGFDAALEFPPHLPATARVEEVTDRVQLLNSSFSGKVYDYRELVEKQLSRKDSPDFDLFRGVMTGWDNEPRRPGQGIIYAFSTPKAYGRWLEYACKRTIAKMEPEKRLIFINAWNEWSEGAYLEPDHKFGYAYLVATRRVLQSLTKTRRVTRFSNL